jgi:hypothetical protein
MRIIMMDNRCLQPWLVIPASLLLAAAVQMPGVAGELADVKAIFANPPREYSSGPLWVWNDMLTEDQIRSTLHDLAGQHVKQAWVHPRPGLMTPYLGKDWFRMWNVALEEAERLDMNIWIYDENSYPSGFAGGLVPEAMPESRGQGLHFNESKRPAKPTKEMVAVYRLTDDRAEDVTTQVRAGESLPEGRYLTASVQLAPRGGWFGGTYYVDLIRPGVTDKFLDITFGAYQREIGAQFGKRVPGIFTDEPHLTPAGGIHWNEFVPAEFKQRWGYDLMQHLPSLVEPIGDWKRIRHNYQEFLLAQFIDRWAKPCFEYCEQHGLEFTGHYWEHGWPGASHGGDNMAMYAWHQRPSIDNLMNQYDEGVHAQFGNARTVRELASVANQLGRKRTLCEAYGAGGWDLRFEDMKRIGDWLYVLGVNTLNQHLSYVTIRGARKRDHPQSFSYHTPWWPDYHQQADYFARLSLVMSAGQQVNHVLVIEPTTSAWMYQPDASTRAQLDAIGNSFQTLTNTLERAQAEYDIGCEDIILRHGRVVTQGAGDDGPQLVIGQRSYDLIVLAQRTENLNGSTLRLLEQYVGAGGKVLCCGPPPARVDGQLSDRGTQLAAAASWHEAQQDQVVSAVVARSRDGLTIDRREGDQGLLFHHRRRLRDGSQFLLLVNTSIEHASQGTIESTEQTAQQWDLVRGTTSPSRVTFTPKGIRIPFHLPPCGSLLLLLGSGDKPASTLANRTTEEKKRLDEGGSANVQPVGATTIRRVGPNVLTLDYVDVAVGDAKLASTYFYKAQQFVFNQNGMAGNPWDSAVQLRDTLITRKFPPESGFQATYRFTISSDVPRPLGIVIERPDLYTITCNGQAVQAEPDAWWLDKSFGQIDLTETARSGANAVTITARPMTIWHELESAYLLGNFSLDAAKSGFVVVPARPLKLGSPETAGWNRQGCPFYAEGVAYRQSFDVANLAGRYLVSLPAWYGAVARVHVNGKQAGQISVRPWQCDVTRSIQPGRNTIEVVVVGTLRNTLGPHHAGHIVGQAWPHIFRQAPATGPPAGAAYDTLGYGLSKPFELLQVGGPSASGGR